MAAVFLAGCVFFPATFYTCVRSLERFYRHALSDGDIYTISNRSVSALQAIMASAAGGYIVSMCPDILQDSHWLSNTYCLFALPYLYYDAWAMYEVYWRTHPSLHQLTPWRPLVKFFKKHILILLHHLVLPAIYAPFILWYRRGLGDFYIGCFYLMELAVPFISIRAVQVQLKRTDGWLYFINGILLIIVFFACRVLIFPYMYWRYGKYVGEPVWRVMFIIPKKCTLGCLVILLLQAYWMHRIIAATCSTIKRVISTYQKSHRELNQ